MDTHKLAQEAMEALRHGHLPLFFGLIGAIRILGKIEYKDNCERFEGIGEDDVLATGDNFPVF